MAHRRAGKMDVVRLAPGQLANDAVERAYCRVLFFRALESVVPGALDSLLEEGVPIILDVVRDYPFAEPTPVCYAKLTDLRPVVHYLVQLPDNSSPFFPALDFSLRSRLSRALFPQLLPLRDLILRWTAGFKLEPLWCRQTAAETVLQQALLDASPQTPGIPRPRHFEFPFLMVPAVRLELPPFVFRFGLEDAMRKRDPRLALVGPPPGPFDPFAFLPPGFGQFDCAEEHYQPLLEARAEAETRLTAAFAAALGHYLDATDALFPSLTQAHNKRSDLHFRWLTRYQCRGESFPEIARVEGYQRDTVKQAVSELAAVIGLKLRPGRRGRPSKNSATQAQGE